MRVCTDLSWTVRDQIRCGKVGWTNASRYNALSDLSMRSTAANKFLQLTRRHDVFYAP
jgi:hypothetical protein